VGRTLELFTNSAEETRAIGRAIGGLLGAGDVVSLTGDLGAGKTTFVQGAAQALEVKEPVLSPTFTLIREYQGSFRVYHLDVYRLDRVQDVLELGVDEIFERGGVSFVEWGDAVDSLLPEAHLQVELQLPDTDSADADGQRDRRRLLVSAMGDAWAPRWSYLVQVTQAWQSSSSETAGGQR
jgi:tRNA threonylcarbamoyladenosine biosynthesis protein TsaE